MIFEIQYLLPSDKKEEFFSDLETLKAAVSFYLGPGLDEATGKKKASISATGTSAARLKTAQEEKTAAFFVKWDEYRNVNIVRDLGGNQLSLH
jgi:hypothetical protein